ncbi:helix-turn-helix transcriptional regulator [Streptomyces sp. BE282]|uniref:helix-turn-helix domain-containing protein n=1 Tax=Streptomyces sp. BE282 TaxID=3002527 RepID=UPI002E782641|nr:helix-turn-helix transcriptional regulator [Streptomyces sp. BE282]MEE1729223.1 helix-turn-helix transcriptional regulator [Streptomyces sp. BE282]
MLGERGTGEGSAREALAERLQELREGSGRTYASLARRIGVSGSTLHRYCTGQTVPAEFAPVERLARLCGRSGEEREALHRLWLRADAERVERQEAGMAGSPASGVGEDAEAGAAPGTGTEAGAYPARGSRGTPTGTWALSGSVPPAAAAVHRDEDSSAYAGRPPAHAPRSRSVRRWVQALAICTVAALALVLVAASAGPSRQQQRPERQPPVARPAAPPFTWTSDDHVWKYGCGHTYLVGGPPAAVPPPPAEADAESWATALGAVHAGETGVRITLQGTDERAVVLEALRIRVVERREPAEGRVHRMSSGCGGALTPRMFDVDLDVARPVARSVPGNNTGEPIPAVSFPYRVSASDPEVFLVTGRAADCDCDWVAELRWSSGGRSGTVRIDDGGRPFRTSGAPGRPVHDYDFVTRRWVAEP